MKFEDLKNEAENDLNLDETNIKQKSLENSRIYTKWLNYFREVSKAYKEIEDKKNKKYRELYEYYRDDYSIKLKTNEIDIYVKSEQEFITLNRQLNNYKSILEYIEGVLKEISRMNFNIKNYIEWQKFQNGVL